MKEHNNNNLQLIAISFMILGMFFLSINDVTVKWLSKEYPIWEIVFFSGNKRNNNFYWISNEIWYCYLKN